MRNLLVIGILCSVLALNAQVLTGISTVYNDSFVAWVIDTDLEGITGELTQRWQLQNNWGEWDYHFDESSGSVRRPFKEDASQWNVTGDGLTVTAKTVWPGDLREWRVTNNDISLTMVCKWNNSAEEWYVREKTHGTFRLYTSVEGDARDWTIIDQLDDDISIAMKMALLSVAILNSVPKE